MVILAHAPQPIERSFFLLLSRRLCNEVTPDLYSSWKCYGGGHSFKAFYCFPVLLLYIVHRDLVTHVQTLDLRDREPTICCYDTDKTHEYTYFKASFSLPIFSRTGPYTLRDPYMIGPKDVLLALLLTKLPSPHTIFTTIFRGSKLHSSHVRTSFGF